MSGNVLRTAILFAASLGHAGCSAGSRPGNNSSAQVQDLANQKEATMQIRIISGDKVITARLEDTVSARDFAALLPLRVTLKDYASTEKIADLPRALTIEGAPAAIEPVAGDLAYYAPWGNVALFYRDGHRSPRLVRLARIEGDSAQLVSVDGPVSIEAAE